MKWAQIPSGPRVDLDEVVAVEDGRYETGSRFVLRNGRCVEVAASREALLEFFRVATTDPRDREVANLKRENGALRDRLDETRPSLSEPPINGCQCDICRPPEGDDGVE